MSQPISKFFQNLGFPLKNIRWSWGANSDSVFLLRTWEDHFSFKNKEVAVLQTSWFEVNDSYGLDERVNQLKTIWAGGATAYTVMASVRDRSAIPREIKDYRDDSIFFIKQLRVRDDGDLVAVLGELVAVQNLTQHAKSHTTEAAIGPFPVNSGLITGVSTEGYKEKISAIRDYLINVCERRAVVTYSEVMDRFGLTYFPLVAAMGLLGRECRTAEEPIITAVIVNKDTLTCSDGIRVEFGVENDQAERERCYVFWDPKRSVQGNLSHPEPDSEVDKNFDEMARRFSLVELRPQQAKFRAAVFNACNGRCVVSGCDIPEALEAAHLEGRSWRSGHNEATDGVLLRRDLHALYDRGLLSFKEDGTVLLASVVLTHYEKFQGVMIDI